MTARRYVLACLLGLALIDPVTEVVFLSSLPTHGPFVPAPVGVWYPGVLVLVRALGDANERAILGSVCVEE